MSQHPSLLGSQKGKQHRSVLKRYEKLKHLKEKDKWDEETNSIYSLPKIKSIRFKVKKEKAATPEAEAAGVAPTPGATAAAQPQAAQAQPAGAKSAAGIKLAAGAKPAAEKTPAQQKDKKAKA